jgi:hypothetical protein
MARKSLKPVAEKLEGSFLDVEVPELDWIKVDLIHNRTKWVDSKTENVEKIEENFNIVINLSEKVLSEDKELSTKIKEICHLSFPPYYWREKSYRFYTTDRTGSLEEKKEILTNLFQLLSKYELDKKSQFEVSSEVFKEDAKNKVTMESVDLLMKFHEPTKRFVVLAKDFLGPEKFALLRKCSEYSTQLSPPSEIVTDNKFLITTDFFAEELPGKKLDKKTYFFINPSYYEEIKHHFNLEASRQKEFVEKQKRITQENNLSQYNIEIDNPFGLKIKFVEENQCFEFYGKGYFENQGYGDYAPAPRTLLGIWALNFIYSKDKVDPTSYTIEEMFVDKDKIELEQVQGGTKREKNVRIPASEWPKIKEIKENFEKEMAIWGREEKSIKITHCDFNGPEIFSSYPAIYFDSKGKAFLAYGSRRTGSFKAIGQSSINDPIFDQTFSHPATEQEGTKKKRESKFSQNLKTIPISFEEAKFFMNEHPFAENIQRGTFELNAVIHSPTNPDIMNFEEKKKVFDTVYLHAEIHAQAEKDGLNKPKVRRIKI